MKKVTTLSAILGFLGLGASAFAQFSNGNLVLSLVKSNASGTAATNAASRHTLRELKPDGTSTGAADVDIWALASEVSASGTNRRATLSGSATSEGFISLSADNRYILFVGYDADLGAQGPPTGTPPTPSSIVNTASTDVNRVVGRYDWTQPRSAASLVTSTYITDAFSLNNIRSAASLDGSQFWLAGANGSARYSDATLAAGTSTQLATAPTNLRVIKIFNGQLYVSSGSGAFTGLNTVGTGLPTTVGQTITNFIANASSPYDFVFEGDSTVYIADDNITGTGGLQKWVRSGTTWSRAVTYLIPGINGVVNAGLRGVAQAGSNVFYATTNDGNQVGTTPAPPNRLVKITVTGSNPSDVTVNTLATALTDEYYRDVKVLPNSISGKITFQSGLANVPLNQQLRVTLTAGSITLNTTVTPDAQGNFTVLAPAGNYRIKVKTAGSLSEAANANTTTGNVAGINFTLRGGDINDDNAADISDLLILINAYNKLSGQSGFSPAADINKDGADDISDLLILITNYNQLGNS